MRGTRLKPTAMQQRAIDLNLTKGGTMKVEEILLKAGYDSISARPQTNVMAGIKPHLAESLEWMKRHRMMVMEQMDLKIDDATYGKLRKSLDPALRREADSQHRHCCGSPAPY